MRIYLDTCCWGRPFDDQSIARNYMETLAVMSIVDTCRLAGHCIVGSTAVIRELQKIKDTLKQIYIKSLYMNNIDEHFVATAKEYTRAQSLHAQGVSKKDSIHLAAAEAGEVNFLLTTDDDFEKIVKKKNLSSVKVINPLKISKEMLK